MPAPTAFAAKTVSQKPVVVMKSPFGPSFEPTWRLESGSILCPLIPSWRLSTNPRNGTQAILAQRPEAGLKPNTPYTEFGLRHDVVESLGPPALEKPFLASGPGSGLRGDRQAFKAGVGVPSDVCPPLKRGAIFSYTSYTATGTPVDPVLEALVPQTFANICLPLSSHSRILGYGRRGAWWVVLG